MKFSIIVPVYNVENYLSKCIESIINQTNQEFELLLINDGTKDNSQKIIDTYVNKYPDKIQSFIKKNGGLSDTRNYGVERAKGEYIIFIDSDDYVDTHLLEKINAVIINDNKPDVIGYSLKRVDLNNNELEIIKKPEFHLLSGKQAIFNLVESKKIFEPACGYAYNREYWLNNNYKYEINLYHEDFALTPIVILKANKVSSISFSGYFYVQTDNSIMRNNSAEKMKKKNTDLLKAFDILKSQIETVEEDKNVKMLKAYIANAILYRYFELGKEYKKEYKKELVKRNITNWLINDSIKRKIRKLLIIIKFYVR